MSQASFIHVRNGRDAIEGDRFNQAYMMHATTSPLYAIAASNDITSAMMDGPSGAYLTQEVIREAVDFRQTLCRIKKKFAKQDSWFFKPWNADKVKDEKGFMCNFEEAPRELLVTFQDCWVLRPNDTWHGFGDIKNNWCLLDPIKVSILTPGMGTNGNILETGVPAKLVTAYLSSFGIVPTRTTDFQIMFIFSIGITKGKWGTLLTHLLAFKRHYDSDKPVAEILPELVFQNESYRNMGLRELGEKCSNL